MNLSNILTYIGIISAIIGGVYFAEDRYAHVVTVNENEANLRKDISEIRSMLPKQYTKIRNFYSYRLRTEARWVANDLSKSNAEMDQLKSNSANLTPNQRIYVRNLEQRIGRLLNQQQEIDKELTELNSIHRGS